MKKQEVTEKPLNKQEEAERERKRRKKQIKDILAEMKETRNAFIAEIIAGKYRYPEGHDAVKEMWQIYMEIICRGGGLYKNRILDFYGVDQYEESEKTKEIIEEFGKLDMEKQMLIMLSDGSQPYEATVYSGAYNKDMGTLRCFYRVLQKYGFTFGSLEEIKILDGTHELYTKEEKGNDD